MLDLHSQMILDEFIENRKYFEEARVAILNKLGELITQSGLVVSNVDSRVKTVQSLTGKLELKGYKYNSIKDITDVIGLRVITYYNEDVDKIAAMMEQHFSVDWENSIDKRKIYDSDRFGYMSLHYVCHIPKNIYFDPACPLINECGFEIQMKTVIQHAWAMNTHDSGYKSDVEIPWIYQRRFSRLAGILELADDEFTAIRREIDEYRRKVRDLLKSGKFEELELDADTFHGYLDIDPYRLINEKVASVNQAEIHDANMMSYLPALKAVGFKTIADLEKMRKEYANAAEQLGIHQIGITDLDIISSSMALQNLVSLYIMKEGKGVEQLKEFNDIIFGERKSNERAANRVAEQIKRLNLI